MLLTTIWSDRIYSSHLRVVRRIQHASNPDRADPVLESTSLLYHYYLGWWVGEMSHSLMWTTIT